MKINLLLLVLLLWCSIAHSQEKGFSLKRYKNQPALAEQLKSLRKLYSGFTVGLGYERMNFLNPVFQRNLKAGDLERGPGYYFNFRVLLYPLSLDVNRFNTDFRSSYFTAGDEENPVFHQRGWEYLLSAYPMFYGKMARIFAPYIGAGYQFSHLCVNCEQNYLVEEDRTKMYYNARTSAPVWKAGLLIRLGKVLYLEGEYKQTFPLKDRFSTGTWRVGAGVQFGKD